MKTSGSGFWTLTYRTGITAFVTEQVFVSVDVVAVRLSHSQELVHAMIYKGIYR